MRGESMQRELEVVLKKKRKEKGKEPMGNI